MLTCSTLSRSRCLLGRRRESACAGGGWEQATRCGWRELCADDQQWQDEKWAKLIGVAPAATSRY